MILRLLHRHQTFFRRVRFQRVPSGTAVKIMPKSNEKSQTKRSRGKKAMVKSVCKILVALSPMTRRVARLDLHPRACLLDAASGRVIHLYTHSSSSNDTKSRSCVFGAGTMPWTDLARSFIATISDSSLEQLITCHTCHPPCLSFSRIARANGMAVLPPYCPCPGSGLAVPVSVRTCTLGEKLCWLIQRNRGSSGNGSQCHP